MSTELLLCLTIIVQIFVFHIILVHFGNPRFFVQFSVNIFGFFSTTIFCEQIIFSDRLRYFSYFVRKNLFQFFQIILLTL